ncbi:MAG: VOC family protein [Gemmatimonadota bacterium]
MNAPTHNAAPNIFPALRYQDGPAAVEWLERVFGFEEQMVVPGAEGTVAHAELRFGPGVIMLGSARTHEKDNPWATEKQGIYVYVADVDAHYERAKAAGAEIVREIQDTDYGGREYSVRDLEGHLWGFGTYRPEGS